MRRLTTFVAFALLAPPLFAQAKPWEHQRSDLAADPRIHFASLKNGMRVAWMANGEPKKRCYLRLHVDVGSLAEEESERGIAHFLEHMAFNGSKHFPAGTLVEWFQKHGMAFGADTNAHTGFSETVYELDLPESDAKTVGEGFVFLRDVADGLLLEPKEIDAEKGVIDAEERERDSAAFRVFVKSIETLYDGTRVPQRMPIGTKPARDKFDAAALRRFYSKWYRPEAMTLVVVGDIGDLDIGKLAEESFGSLAVAAAPLPGEPASGTPSYKTPFFSITEKEMPIEQIRIARSTPFTERADDKKTRVERLALECARGMLNLRFAELAKKENASFVNAGAEENRAAEAMGIRVEGGESLRIVAPPEKWEAALGRCEKELRRAVEHGFEKSELDEVRANALRALDEAVEQEKTRASLSHAEEIVSAAEGRHVPTDAASERALLKPAFEALTVEACHKAFAKAWGEGTLTIAAIGAGDLGADGGARVKTVYEESAKKAVKAQKTAAQIPFAYTSSAEKAGKIRSRKSDAEFGIEEVVFENGVVLRVKKTDFKERQVLLDVRFGEGGLTLEPDRRELAFVAEQAFAACGLGAHSADDLRKLMAGKEVAVSFGMDEDAFRFEGSTTQEDLLKTCEVLAAYFTDPGWREEGLRPVMQQTPIFYEALKHQPFGPLLTQFFPALYSGDLRRSLPPLEKVQAVSIPAMREWLTPQLATAPIAANVVGDVDVEATVRAVAQTLGALPARRAPDRLEARRKPAVLKTGARFDYEIDSMVPKTLVYAVFASPDGRDATMRRKVGFLATIVTDRLRTEVREKAAASYAPQARAQMSEVYPNDGHIGIQAMAEPAAADSTLETCMKVAESLATTGPTADEVERAREPALAQLRDAQRTNGYWLSVLADLARDPQSLAETKAAPEFYRNVKAEELAPLAAQVLRRARATSAVISPKKTPESKPAETK